MATQSKSGKSGGGKAQVKLADMKPQKDAKGGKKLGKSKLSQNLAGGGGMSFGARRSPKSGIAQHEN